MKYLVTAQEMKHYDKNTIEKIGISGMVLMERAALAVFERIQKQFGQSEADEEKTVFILAGIGNNGGDGLALARLLAEAGYIVDVHYVGDENKASEQWKKQREILAHYPVTITVGDTGSKTKEKEYTIYVDALFGIGLSREVTGEYARAIDAFNAGKGYKIALDVPSGVNSDTGCVHGCAVKADVTVTFGFCKRGLVLFPGCEYTGEVVTAGIGITDMSFFEEVPGMFAFDKSDVVMSKLLPKRSPAGNKGTFGKVLLIAGDMNMAGAAILSARAAYRTGAGMVKIISSPENRVILQETLPEALLGTRNDLEESLNWADVIAVGPGIGKREDAFFCLQKAICDNNLPIVIDADGLNLLAGNGALQQDLSIQKDRTVILTPHVGELSRLTGQSIASLKENLSDEAMKLAKRLHCIVVAKDARTFICAEKEPVYVNLYGNSGMATAGSGDVLSGIIAGLLAQGMPAFEAACNGVCLHALAGDAAAEERGEHALMAGDIAEYIGKN